MATWTKNKVKQLAHLLGMTSSAAKEFGDQVNRLLSQLGRNAVSFEEIGKAASQLPVASRTPGKVVSVLSGSDQKPASPPPPPPPPTESENTALHEAREDGKAKALWQTHWRTHYYDHEPEFGPWQEPEFGPWPVEELALPANQEAQRPRMGSPFADAPARDGQTGWWYRQQQSAPRQSGMQPIETHVAGVTLEGRQYTVARLMVGERLWLRREPHNPHDRNAILVVRHDGAQVGYIPKEKAAAIAPTFDRAGQPVQAEVTALLGRDYPGQHLGVRIRFVVPEDVPVGLPDFDEIERKFDV